MDMYLGIDMDVCTDTEIGILMVKMYGTGATSICAMDLCMDICIDMCINMRIEMCRDMCSGMCMDMCMDMCMKMHTDMRHRYVHGHSKTRMDNVA